MVAPAESVRILVVDDEPQLERLVTMRFRQQIRKGEFSFEFAGDGLEAIEKLRNNADISVVLSDINMPGMDGLTLLEKLQINNRDMRCVIISAYGDMQNIRTAMSLGAYDFLTKPIDFDDLRTTLDKTIEEVHSLRKATETRQKLSHLEELDALKSLSLIHI